MALELSIIIPVYNRPKEIAELLESLVHQTFTLSFEIVIVEDGSTIPSAEIVEKYSHQLHISYYTKKNTGPGASRNFGMQQAKGNYYIILDSDCILPPQYLQTVNDYVTKNNVACFGGADAAHHSFSNIQKAINYTMTSFLTTGGIRGHKKSVHEFQPRSFNMGIAKKVFEKTGDFKKMYVGEDIDFSIRIKQSGFKTTFIPQAFVYHKRRISWKKFFKQTYTFGLARPILNKIHPHTAKIAYWFPSVFCVGLLLSVLLTITGFPYFLYLFSSYFFIICIDVLLKTKKIAIAFLSLLAVFIQFFGYGYGFLKASFYIILVGKKPEQVFPNMFFNVDNSK